MLSYFAFKFNLRRYIMNKDMTYVKQLKDYEDAVMAKRLEELPEVWPPAGFRVYGLGFRLP
jgi:hypothetical protein